MKKTKIVIPDYFSVEDIIFMKEHNIRFPKQTRFVSSEQYDSQLYDYSLKVTKLRKIYTAYTSLMDKACNIWSEYLSYTCFLGKKSEKIDLPKKRKIYSKLGLNFWLNYFSNKNARIRITLNKLERLCFLEKDAVIRKILEDAIKNTSSDLDVIILKSDYLILYKENKAGFKDIVNRMAEGKYKGFVGIISAWGCEHIAFVSKYVDVDRILKVWKPMCPLSVKCTYIPHNE